MVLLSALAAQHHNIMVADASRVFSVVRKVTVPQWQIWYILGLLHACNFHQYCVVHF